MRELADSYKKLGDVQGFVLVGNLGRSQDAIASYRKALSLRDALKDEDTSDPKVQAGYLSNLSALMSLERFAGNPEEAKRLQAKATKLADRWAASKPPHADVLAAASSVYGDRSSAYRFKEDFATGAASARRCLELLSQAAALEPANPARVSALASGYLGAGYVELDAGRYEAAIADFNQGNRLLDRLLLDRPADASLRRSRMVFLHKIGEATWNLRRKEKGRSADALPFLQQAYQMGNDLVMDDPANDGAENDLANLCQPYGSILLESGKPAEALPLFERGIEILSRHLRNAPDDSNTASNLAIIRVWTSDCRRDLHDLNGALNESRQAAQLWDRLLAMRPGTFRFLHQKADNLNTMGNLLALKGDMDGARKCFREGLEIAENLPRQDASYSTSVVIDELRKSEANLPRSRPGN